MPRVAGEALINNNPATITIFAYYSNKKIMSSKKQRIIQAIKNGQIKDEKSLEFWTMMDEIKNLNLVKDLEKKLEQFLNEVILIKGEKGDNPTDVELLKLIKPLIPKPIKGEKGEQGKDGKTPTAKELLAIIKPLINNPDIDLIANRASKLASDELLPKIPTIQQITENIPLEAERVRDSLELLTGDERLDASAIKNLPEATEKIIEASGAQKGFWLYADGDRKGLIQDIDFIGATYSKVGNRATLTIGGSSTFLDLTDTPSAYTDQAGKGVRVNAGADALEFYDIEGGTDEKVKYDAEDPTAGYVADKIVAGTGISLAEGMGANENKLEITSTITQYADADAIAAIKGDASWNATDWDTAYVWGNHALAGYLTSVTAHALTHAVGGADTIFPVDPGSDKFLMWDFSESALVWADTSGHDEVTLDANADTLLSLTGQALGLDTQTANYVFAGPDSGAAAVPTFRALVSADIPDLSGTYLTSLAGAVLTDQSTPQTIGLTGSRLAKLWATDIEVTNAIAGSVTGNAGTVTNATLTTALTVNTGTVTLTGNVANSSVLTIGAGAVSVSGANTGDQTNIQAISDTMANFDTALSDGNFAFAGGAFHDGFSDYVAAEHIDWTSDQGATNIHANNIPDLSGTYQPLDTDLTAIAGLSSADGNFIVGSATGWVAESGATARTSLGLGTMATATATDYALVGQTFYIGTTQVAINRASAALTLAGLTLTTPDIGTPSAGTLTNCVGLPVAGIADGTDGQLITWGADGVATTVATGDAGQVLTSNGAGAAPTFQNNAGGGADTDLSNLASVAINTSLISDTDSTDDLGSSLVYWANLYVDKIYLDADSSIINTDVDAWNAHIIDSTQAHSDYLRNDEADAGVGLTLSGDNSSADTAYVPMVLYNTDATPPAANTVPIGTIYIQYTA